MILCPNCQKELPDGSKFCGFCGTALPSAPVCPSCGNQVAPESAFCQFCGANLKAAPTPAPTVELAPEAPVYVAPAAPVYVAPAAPVDAAPVAEPVYEAPAYEAPAPAEEPKKKKGIPGWLKALIGVGVAGIGLLFLLIVAVVAILIFHKSPDHNLALYMKDQEIFLTDASKIAPWQVTDELFEDATESTSVFAYLTQISEDGKKIFFADEIDEEGYSLYYRSTKNGKKEAVKLDSDLTDFYQVNDKGTLVTYLKDGDLYQHNLQEREKIASEVGGFLITADGKTVLYEKEDSLYRKEGKQDPVKLASDIESLEYVSEDLQTLYYTKEESLYRIQKGGDPEKIASEIAQMLEVYGSGECYYLGLNRETLNYADFVEDDKAAEDAGVTRPVQPEYPNYFDYASYEEYSKAVDEYYEASNAYREAMTAYYEVEARNELREQLADRSFEHETYTLYFYDGEQIQTVEEGFLADTYSFEPHSEVPLMHYLSGTPEAVEKVKLSELTSVYNLENMVQEALNAEKEDHIAIGKDFLPMTEAENLFFAPDGSALYYFEFASEEDDTCDLYRRPIKENKLGEEERCDSGVSPECVHISEDSVLYFKDVKDGKGDLYRDGSRLDFDVNLYTLTETEDGDLLYFTDWNEEKQRGTLKIFAKNKAEKVADDVHDFLVSGEKILYRNDYSTKFEKGTLFVYAGGKSKQIDIDVSAILPVFTTGDLRNLIRED